MILVTVEIVHSGNTCLPNEDYKMSIEFPGINLIQMQVTNKDLKAESTSELYLYGKQINIQQQSFNYFETKSE